MNKPIEAICVLNENNIKGTIIFKEDLKNKDVIIKVNLQGLDYGLHGFHIHKYGDLSQGCTSTCEHYNPYNKLHGGPDDSKNNRHVGDLGNIYSNKKKISKHIFRDKLIKLRGKYSIIGRAVVVHQDEDDLGKGNYKDSKTTGHAGKRLACGVIGYSKNN